jgi:CBS-domain-containing membrane protein
MTARDDELLGVVSARMVKAGLKRMPVVDSRGRLAGMLSRLDILRQVATAAPSGAHEAVPSGSATTVRDVMNPSVPTVHLGDGLGVLVEKFLQSGTHRLIVVDREGKAVGLISDSDVVARVQPAHQRGLLDAFRRRGAPPAAEASAQALMSPEPLTAPPDRTLVAAVQVMLTEGRKWLVVVDVAGKPLGLVDRGILLRAITSHYEG